MNYRDKAPDWTGETWEERFRHVLDLLYLQGFIGTGEFDLIDKRFRKALDASTATTEAKGGKAR